MMSYYIVEISPDCKGRRGEPALSKELEKEIEEWIIDLWKSGACSPFIWKYFRFLVYEFSTEEAALAFKLRWI
ncbi:hypothetical protein LCGC14_1051190 [marine sediment metagenome]|uniref:Uncharacterized protein n=1 Tax=marine sediment metagenome TaxID=412755 RepID=A0A0F9QUV5_9ZZZZ